MPATSSAIDRRRAQLDNLPAAVFPAAAPAELIGAGRQLRQLRLIIPDRVSAGVFMGLGIASMHYIGMAAMTYDAALLAPASPGSCDPAV